MNDLVLHPEQFIFAQESELKTTSLKIAEAFGKRHDHVIRDIKKIIEGIKNIDNAPKFGLVEYEDAKGELRPLFDMDKDGFILVVMGYTGAKAMAIKVAYINAFNFMSKKLFPSNQCSLPEPPTITTAQIGVLFNRVAEIAAGSGKIRTQLWSRFQNKFNLSSYKNLPADQFDEALAYLDEKQTEYLGAGVEMLYISNKELESMIEEKASAVALPADHLVNLRLNVGNIDQRLLISTSDGKMQISPVADDAYILTREQFKNNLHEVTPGYRLVDKRIYNLLENLQNELTKKDKA